MVQRISVPTFVKWAGGKTQLLDQFRNFYPKNIKRYFEPFLGSGAVFFYIKKSLYRPKEVFLSDINGELISCFRVVRDNPTELIELLKEHKAAHFENPKKYYYEMRDKDPKKMSNLRAAARFIYLNKTCYNGLYRVNSKGKFNVPFGRYKNPSIVNEKNIKDASLLLQGAKIDAIPFEKISPKVKSGDFVYFDPPYFPLTKTSNFTNYTKDAFYEKDQKKLANLFRKLDKKGASLMLSNSNHPLIRTLYSGYRTETVKAARAISCVATGRGKISELVIRNYKNYKYK